MVITSKLTKSIGLKQDTIRLLTAFKCAKYIPGTTQNTWRHSKYIFTKYQLINELMTKGILEQTLALPWSAYNKKKLHTDY